MFATLDIDFIEPTRGQINCQTSLREALPHKGRRKDALRKDAPFFKMNYMSLPQRRRFRK